LKLGCCIAVGCGQILEPDKLLCEKHEAMLWPDVVTALYRAHRPGRKPSKKFAELVDRALLGILWFQHVGHRKPEDVEFQWDD